VKFLSARTPVKISLLSLLISLVPLQYSQGADTLVFNNSTGTFGQWNQGPSDIFLNKITAPAGSVITVIKSGWAANITTQASTNTIYIFTDVSNAPSSVAATFTYSSNDGSNWATYTGTYTVRSGGTFWLGQRASSGITNSGGANANQISNGWSISYSTRYYGTSLAGPFTNQGSASSPLWQIFTGTTATSLSTPFSPVLSATSSTISASETSTISNASSYLIRLFASNGTTLVDSKTVTSSGITSPTVFTGLSPNTQYKVGVVAIGDGINYLDSALSPLSSITTSPASSTTTLSVTGAPSQLSYRTVSQLQVTISGSTGYVKFKANGKQIPQCVKVMVSASTANCNWKPSLHGLVTLTASFISTDSSYISSEAVPLQVRVVARSNRR
jgi:hypothetical protein